MSPDRSRGEEKAAELLWMLRCNSSTNSYCWVISRERGGSRPSSLGGVAHQSEAAAAWVTLHCWDSSVTWQTECDSSSLLPPDNEGTKPQPDGKEPGEIPTSWFLQPPTMRGRIEVIPWGAVCRIGRHREGQENNQMRFSLIPKG